MYFRLSNTHQIFSASCSRLNRNVCINLIMTISFSMHFYNSWKIGTTKHYHRYLIVITTFLYQNVQKKYDMWIPFEYVTVIMKPLTFCHALLHQQRCWMWRQRGKWIDFKVRFVLIFISIGLDFSKIRRNKFH